MSTEIYGLRVKARLFMVHTLSGFYILIGTSAWGRKTAVHDLPKKKRVFAAVTSARFAGRLKGIYILWYAAGTFTALFSTPDLKPFCPEKLTQTCFFKIIIMYLQPVRGWLLPDTFSVPTSYWPHSNLRSGEKVLSCKSPSWKGGDFSLSLNATERKRMLMALQ